MRKGNEDETSPGAVRCLPPAGTGRVAGDVGIALQSADYRLHRLERDGEFRSKDIGSTPVRTVTESE